MGNTLTRGNTNIIDDNTLLGKEISKILENKEKTVGSKKGPYKIPINKARACCLGVVKENPRTNDFITVKLPKIIDKNNPYCRSSGDCIAAKFGSEGGTGKRREGGRGGDSREGERESGDFAQFRDLRT